MLNLVECIFKFRCVVDWLRWSQLHTRVQIYMQPHTPMAMAHASGLILIAVEYTTHACVDFGRTVPRRFICFGAYWNSDNIYVVWLQSTQLIVFYIYIYTCNHTPMATAHGSKLMYMQLLWLQWRWFTAPDIYIDFGAGQIEFCWDPSNCRIRTSLQ